MCLIRDKFTYQLNHGTVFWTIFGTVFYGTVFLYFAMFFRTILYWTVLYGTILYRRGENNKHGSCFYHYYDFLEPWNFFSQRF